jgi:hypothetical protein
VAAWRTRHGLTASVPGIGSCPRPRREAAAWRSLQHRIDVLRRGAVGTPHTAVDRPASPPATTTGGNLSDVTGRDPRRILVALQQARTAVTVLSAELPQLDGEPSAGAEEFAEEALRRALEGEPSAASWLDHLPPPDTQDVTQQEQWKALVATIVTYRWTQHAETPEPLGDAPVASGARSAWEAAHSALQELQSAHVERRLAQIRAQRAGHPGEGAAMPGATRGGQAVGRARPAQSHPQHRHRPPNPGGPGRPRRQ